MKVFHSILLTLGVICAAGCGKVQGTHDPGAPDNILFGLDPGTNPTRTPIFNRSYQTDVLLFVGSGTWATEVANLENILSSHNASYHEVSSAQLDSMSVDEMSQYGVMIFPGGNGASEANSLSSDTHANLRTVVQERGVSYFGICAGAFIADAPAPAPGQDVSYGLGVVNGPVLDYYSLANQGIDISMTLEKFPDGGTKDILWYGGPTTPDKPNAVIAKYPDGSPAISQLWSGKGFVVLSGPHPTATQYTLAALGVTSSDGDHLDFAWQLVDAALHQAPLPTF